MATAQPAHPQALADWRQAAGEAPPEAIAWARDVLGVDEAGQKAS